MPANERRTIIFEDHAIAGYLLSSPVYEPRFRYTHAVIPGERIPALRRGKRGKGTQWLGQLAMVQTYPVVLIAIAEASPTGSPSLA
jgi:hypothetical protein